MICLIVFFLMIRPPPRSTRTDTLFPYTTLFRSDDLALITNFSDGSSNFHFNYRSLVTIRNPPRSEEHTYELKSLMRISYAVLCLKKKNIYKDSTYNDKN